MKRFLLLLSVCTSAALAGSAVGQVVTLTAIEDTFVSAANPNSNYGGSGAVGAAAAALPKGEFDALFKFDLAAAKTSFDGTFGVGQWAIQTLALQLTATPPNNVIFNGNGAGPSGTNVNFAGVFALQWMQNDGWLEGSGTPASPTTNGVTFATLGSFLNGADESLGTFSFGGATSGTTTSTLLLTPSFLADATAGSLVSLRALPADSGVAYLMSSRTVGTPANRPQLTVTAAAVPEPGTTALLAGAAMLWLARRRRPRRGGRAFGVRGF